MSKYIEVEGLKYKVIETLSYCQAGMPAKAVETNDGEKVAVKRGGKWTWWTVKDRIGHGSLVKGQ